MSWSPAIWEVLQVFGNTGQWTNIASWKHLLWIHAAFSWHLDFIRKPCVMCYLSDHCQSSLSRCAVCVWQKHYQQDIKCNHHPLSMAKLAVGHHAKRPQFAKTMSFQVSRSSWRIIIFIIVNIPPWTTADNIPTLKSRSNIHRSFRSGHRHHAAPCSSWCKDRLNSGKLQMPQVTFGCFHSWNPQRKQSKIVNLELIQEIGSLLPPPNHSKQSSHQKTETTFIFLRIWKLLILSGKVLAKSARQQLTSQQLSYSRLFRQLQWDRTSHGEWEEVQER